MAQRRSGRALLAAAVLLAAVTVTAFAPVLRNGFVAFDDDTYVTQNPFIAEGVSGPGIAWAFTSVGYASNWHPLTWLSHMADVEMFGMDPRGHHRTSLVLHTAAAVLLFLVLAAMTGMRWPSLLAALLFAVHPLRVESVAWVAERKDVLAAFLGMLTLGAYLAYVRRPSTGRYGGAVGLFALGLLAKPILVTLPVVMLLLDFWPFGRLGVPPARGADARPHHARPHWRPVLLEKLPFFALAAVVAAVTVLAQARGRGFSPAAATAFPVRLANAVVAAGAYLVQTLLPQGLSCFYPYPDGGPPFWQTAASGFALLAVTAVVVRRAGGTPFLVTGWFWFLAMLLPVIGLVQVGDQSRADRYTYLPHAGLSLLIAWAVSALARRRPRARACIVAAAAAAVAVLVALSRAQTGYWRDSMTLFARASAVTDNNWLAEYNLGTLLSGQRRFAAAEGHLAAALALKPDDGEIRHNLGAVLLQLRRFDEAIPLLAETVRRRPDFADARFHLGLALEMGGRPGEAAPHFAAALRLRPDDVEARIHLERINRNAPGSRDHGSR